MDLQKQTLPISFRSGIDKKTDPYQVPAGRFDSLVNSVFDSLGRLTKRNGFPNLATLPNTDTSYLTTFNGNLQALGNNLLAYSAPQMDWISKGSTYPIQLDTLPLIRNSTNQRQCDSATAENGLICTVYTDQDPSSLGNPIYKYCIADSTTGQNIVAPTPIPVSSGVVTNAPRVFLLGNHFILLFGNLITGVNHLQYVAVSTINPTIVTANQDVSASFSPSSTLAFDAFIANGNLYMAWNGGAASGVKVSYLQPNLVQGNTINPDAAHAATLMSVCADNTLSSPVVWVSYYNSATSNGYTLVVDLQLNVVLAATQIISAVTALNLTSSAQNSINRVFYEVSNNYSYDGAIPTHFVNTNTITQAGTVGSPVVSARSVGLASKSFIIDSVVYYLAAYSSTYQPTYFLINGSTSTSAAPITLARLAYANGGGYLITGLPSVSVDGESASVPYLIKDLIQAVNKDTNVATGTQTAGIFSQTGVNLATFTLNTEGLQSGEIGANLQLTGGFLWNYDGYVPVENNFFLWPDSVESTTATGSGNLVAQDYYYQATYEWADNQGNVYRSAPSIPIKQTTTTASSTNTIKIPTLRLTYKISNPVKIVLYRWSTAQQIYYQVTSLTVPTLNSTTVDNVTITDTFSDATILGNNILYTTGGVIENTATPASSITTLFDTRFWLVDSEDKNLLWFSKQVIEATPVEMSDLLTIYVAPSIGAQGSTGPITALGPQMDDKLPIFKENAIYYINGAGPDNTGNNNQYSQPVFVTATVGCANPRSIVMIPAGLVFQSNKGIWLLGRDLSTSYIGAEVESFNSFAVTSAVTIPGTNQVRFSMSNGTTLMYDYFVGQWGTFEGVPSVSSTIYNDLHTIVDQYGRVSQESPGTYLDGSRPVLMSFITSWLRLEGLRGYQRAYFFYFLGTYLSPHKLQIQIAYDYNSSPWQSDLFSPEAFPGYYGDDPYYGGDGTAPFGGINDTEQGRVFFERMRCKAFQLSIAEVFDPSFGTVAGAGLTLSGLNCQIGFKKGYAPISAAKSVG